MALRQQIMNTYSVFVGHIHPDVTKRELGDLFKACGDIMDVVILVSSGSSYNFGFVRYQQPEYAFRAVRELNRWLLNGCELVVDISKDTAKKIKDERERDGTSASGSQQQRPQRDNVKARGSDGPAKPSSSGTSNASLFLQDTMYLNRLRENCSKLHLKASDGTGKVAPDILLDDVSRADSVRFPTVWGSLSDPSVNFQRISHKIMQRCRSSSDVDPSLGEKKAVEYLNSLETIMQEIGKVLATREDKTESVEDNTNTAVAEGDTEAKQVEDEDAAVKQCLEEIRNVNCDGADGCGGGADVNCGGADLNCDGLDISCDSTDSGGVNCDGTEVKCGGADVSCVGADGGADISYTVSTVTVHGVRERGYSKSDLEINDLSLGCGGENQNQNEDIPESNCEESDDQINSTSPKQLNVQSNCQGQGEDNLPGDKLTCQYENQTGKCVNCFPKDSTMIYPDKFRPQIHNGSLASGVSVVQNEMHSMPAVVPHTQDGLNDLNSSKSESDLGPNRLYNRGSKTVSLDPVRLFDRVSKPVSLDPAMLDFHMVKPQPKVNVLDELFAKMTVSTDNPHSGDPTEMVRSLSRDSGVSSESNEGNVDDSGVESDFLTRQGQGTKAASLEYLGNGRVGEDRIRGWNHGRPGRKSLPEAGMKQNNPATENKFDLNSYIKNLGRGRGLKPGVVQPGTSRKSPAPLGRGILPMK